MEHFAAKRLFPPLLILAASALVHTTAPILSLQSPTITYPRISDNMDLNPLNGGNFIHNHVRNADGGSFLKRLSLTNKTAIISGSGGGIGFSVANAYAELGCNIAIWYHSNKAAVEKAEALGKQYNVKCKIRERGG